MAAKNGQVMPATEVKNRFGQVLSEIRRTGGPIIVQRGGKPVAVILSIESYERLRPKRTQANRRDAALAAFGMWAERADIDDEWLARGRARWRNGWRNE